LLQWTRETGDNIPENPTPDRKSLVGKGRNPHLEFSGRATGAEKINHPGPIDRN